MCFLNLCHFSSQTSATWPSEWRRVLLLENHRLPFRGQMPLQTHSWSERQRQEALAALNTVYSLPGIHRLSQRSRYILDRVLWVTNINCGRTDQNSQRIRASTLVAGVLETGSKAGIVTHVPKRTGSMKVFVSTRDYPGRCCSIVNH